MKPKLTTVAVVLTLSLLNSEAQTNLAIQYGRLTMQPKGGFEYAEPFRTSENRFSIGFNSRDSSLIGFSAHFATGEKDFTFSYPVFYACEDFNGPYVCVDPTVAPQGFVFRYLETFVGATLFGGRIVQFRLGPYIAYNSQNSRATSFEVDPDYYYPYTLKDMYKRIELGGQVQLSLMLPIGKHFFLQANGLLGTSFNDLRKDKWEDAKSVLVFGNGEYVKMNSEKVSNRFYSYGLGIGFTW